MTQPNPEMEKMDSFDGISIGDKVQIIDQAGLEEAALTMCDKVLVVDEIYRPPEDPREETPDEELRDVVTVVAHVNGFTEWRNPLPYNSILPYNSN